MPQPNNAGDGCQGSPVRGAPQGAGRRPDLDGRRRGCRRVGAARTPPREALSIRPVAAKAMSDGLSGLVRITTSGDRAEQQRRSRRSRFWRFARRATPAGRDLRSSSRGYGSARPPAWLQLSDSGSQSPGLRSRNGGHLVPRGVGTPGPSRGERSPDGADAVRGFRALQGRRCARRIPGRTQERVHRKLCLVLSTPVVSLVKSLCGKLRSARRCPVSGP
jgi:hypothetical protein